MFEDLIERKKETIIKEFSIKISNKEEEEKKKRAKRIEKLIKYAKILNW